jgi:hypothetical protein
MHRRIDTRTSQITMRLAGPGDSAALMRLAALDSADVPLAPTLVAEADRELVAALELDGGRSISDPFQHTSALIEMLELRAAQLTDSHAHRPAHTLAERMRAAARWLGPSPRLP